jgi:hypothetical protein
MSHPPISRVFLHVPKLKMSNNKPYIPKTNYTVNRIYNLSNVNLLEYDETNKQLTIQFASGEVETLNELVEDTGSLKKVFQEITRTLFTTEGTRIIHL